MKVMVARLKDLVHAMFERHKLDSLYVTQDIESA